MGSHTVRVTVSDALVTTRGGGNRRDVAPSRLVRAQDALMRTGGRSVLIHDLHGSARLGHRAVTVG